ncbi:MAG: hypothetical protein K2J67_00160 [Lachnospiraceae bacterium]|nr:hypothetical protein [Lachnospiraceae bacterium]
MTTRLRTISPVSSTVFVSLSGIFGGYSAYKVCAGMTNNSSVKFADTSSGSREVFCSAVSPDRISAPLISTVSKSGALMRML